MSKTETTSADKAQFNLLSPYALICLFYFVSYMVRFEKKYLF